MTCSQCGNMLSDNAVVCVQCGNIIQSKMLSQPVARNQRKIKIAIIEKDAVKKNQTQIFIETPYRNMQLLTDLMQVCSGETLLCVACNLTSENEMVKTMPISEWEKKLPEINKLPAIFLIGN